MEMARASVQNAEKVTSLSCSKAEPFRPELVGGGGVCSDKCRKEQETEI